MTEITIPVGRMVDVALPPPSSYDLIDASVLHVADWRSGGALLHGVPDQQVRPDRWALRWESVPSVVVNAIRAHYRDFGAGTWSWYEPRSTTAVVVVYVEPPTITWNHRTGSASARALIERAIARN